ncbi:hypothetical protein EV378_5531 [Pseudonocardia endophytica]|uniref:Zinc-binding alcohol dehydrogenase family protein n=1 Tax=Pseudonocardia endophytica TaxID=401976 RepID=A0A4R1HKP2_PSEEN|nr:hypothetical protein EV378_5531 [Pseudonocardia endophytica]
MVERRDRLDALRAPASAGRLTPRVAGSHPADKAADAHRAPGAGGMRGRAVLSF